MSRKGVAVLAFDVKHGPHMDLLNDDVYSRLRGWIVSGVVLAIWSGTPCGGLTRARRGPPGGRMPRALRSPEFPQGLPHLEGRDLVTLQQSNLLAARALGLLQLAAARDIPGGEENPNISYLWDLPSRQNFQKKFSTTDYVVDYCACGRPFRARTRLRTFSMQASKRLPRLHCAGRGTCDFTGQPHENLSGTKAGGGFFTAAKTAYPRKLADIIAAELFAAYASRRTTRKWNLLR